jgi:hypothetical protein
MANPPRGAGLRTPPRSPATPGNGDWRRAARPHQGRAAGPARRLDRVTAGFWLGGAGLGAGGCLLGAFLDPPHAAAWVITVLWSGLYWGWFGAVLGALAGLCLGPAAQASAGAGEHPSGADGPLGEGLP